MPAGVRRLARRVKEEVAFYRLVAAHPRTPRLARALIVAAIGYALMPFDLVPDWIPVLGHLDDLVIVPLLAWLGLRMVPRTVIEECRQRARAARQPEGDP